MKKNEFIARSLSPFLLVLLLLLFAAVFFFLPCIFSTFFLFTILFASCLYSIRNAVNILLLFRCSFHFAIRCFSFLGMWKMTVRIRFARVYVLPCHSALSIGYVMCKTWIQVCMCAGVWIHFIHFDNRLNDDNNFFIALSFSYSFRFFLGRLSLNSQADLLHTS